MQANATLETRLPRAVQRMSAHLKDKYTGKLHEQQEPENPQAEGGQPPEAATAETQPPTQATPPADPRENDPAYWKQRFHVTNGILRKERDSRQAAEAQLTQRISTLESELQAARDAMPPPPIDLGEFFTPEQIEEMGETTALAMVTTIKKSIKAEAAKLMRMAQPAREQQEAQAKRDQEARAAAFSEELAAIVPDYQEIDTSDEWHEWLAGEDETGLERQAVLTTHVAALNAQAVGKLFKAFLASQNRPKPPISPSGTGATPVHTPARSAALTAPSKGEITEHFKQRKLGKLKPEDIVEFEKRLALLHP